MGEYSIKDMEKLSGIKAHTIRIWERRYGIFKPDRTGTNRRRYSDEDLRKIINISILNRKGYKISSIASLSNDDIGKKVLSVIHDGKEDDALVESFILAMVNLDEQDFNDILNRSVLKLGFEYTFGNVVFPFLRRVGVLWAAGSINPGQEHFGSNLIRQKMIAYIDGRIYNRKENAKKILLFLPENEQHEFGLLYHAYLTRRNGHEVLYLGQQTPFESVRRSVRLFRPDIIVTGTLSGMSGVSSDYLIRLSSEFSSQLIIITGLLASSVRDRKSGNIVPVNSTEEYIHLIER